MMKDKRSPKKIDVIKRIIREVGMIDITGRWYCFSRRQIKDRPSVQELAKRIEKEL